MREPAAHGRLQVPRRVQFPGVAFARRTSARRRRLLERESRARRRAGGAAVRRVRDDRHADRRARGEAGGDARVTAPRSCPTNARVRTAKRSREGLAAERGATLVPPFDDEQIVAGRGYRCVGTARRMPAARCDRRSVRRRRSDVAARRSPRTARPERSPSTASSRRPATISRSPCARAAVTIPVPETIADGLQTTAPAS